MNLIVDAGVELVTVSPERIYTAKELDENQGLLWELIGILQRANGESTEKSKRISAAFAQKRRAAIEKGTPFNSRCPQWLRLDGDRFVLIPERVAIVKRIVGQAANGASYHAIAKALNADRVEPWGKRAKFWSSNYIRSICRNPALIGSYQFKQASDTWRRVAIGEPIDGYFPRVVTDAQFARLNRETKTKRKGRQGANFPNLFSGLAYDETGGGSMCIRVDNDGTRRFGNWFAIRGQGNANSSTVRLLPFERALLRQIPILLQAEPNEQSPNELNELEGKAELLRGRIADISTHLQTTGQPIQPLLDTITALSQTLSETETAIRSQETVQNAPNEARTIERHLDHLDEPNVRQRIRAALKATVERITLSIQRIGATRRIVNVSVTFKTGRIHTFRLELDGDKPARYFPKQLPKKAG